MKNSFNVQQMKRKLQDLKDNQSQPKAAEEYQLATPPSSTARCPDCGVNYTIGSDYCRICSMKRTSEDGSPSETGSMPALER